MYKKAGQMCSVQKYELARFVNHMCIFCLWVQINSYRGGRDIEGEGSWLKDECVKFKNSAFIHRKSKTACQEEIMRHLVRTKFPLHEGPFTLTWLKAATAMHIIYLLLAS